MVLPLPKNRNNGRITKGYKQFGFENWSQWTIFINQWYIIHYSILSSIAHSPHPTTIYHFLDVLKGLFKQKHWLKLKVYIFKKQNSTLNKNWLRNFQQIYEGYRQKKIDRKSLALSSSYKYKKKGE